jgi:hypothetical protein
LLRKAGPAQKALERQTQLLVTDESDKPRSQMARQVFTNVFASLGR